MILSKIFRLKKHNQYGLFLFVNNNPSNKYDYLGLSEPWLIYDENGNVIGEIGIEAPSISPIDIAEIIVGFGAVRVTVNVVCKKILSKESAILFTKQADNVIGPYGTIGAKQLAKLAKNVEPKTQVFTKLTQPPAPDRALSVAMGKNANEIMNAARETGQVYSANIPTALIEALKRVGLAEEKILVQEGAEVIATEIRFYPAATKYIVDFFK